MQLSALLRSGLFSSVMMVALLLVGVVATGTSVLDQPHVQQATVSADAGASAPSATGSSDPISGHPFGSESPCRLLCAGPDEDCVGLVPTTFAVRASLPATVSSRRSDGTRVVAWPGSQWDRAAVSLLLLSVSRT